MVTAICRCTCSAVGASAGELLATERDRSNASRLGDPVVAGEGIAGNTGRSWRSSCAAAIAAFAAGGCCGGAKRMVCTYIVGIAKNSPRGAGWGWGLSWTEVTTRVRVSGCDQSGTAFFPQAVTLAADGQYLAVMWQSVEDGGDDHHRIAECLAPSLSD